MEDELSPAAMPIGGFSHVTKEDKKEKYLRKLRIIEEKKIGRYENVKLFVV